MHVVDIWYMLLYPWHTFLSWLPWFLIDTCPGRFLRPLLKSCLRRWTSMMRAGSGNNKRTFVKWLDTLGDRSCLKYHPPGVLYFQLPSESWLVILGFRWRALLIIISSMMAPNRYTCSQGTCIIYILLLQSSSNVALANNTHRTGSSSTVMGVWKGRSCECASGGRIHVAYSH